MPTVLNLKPEEIDTPEKRSKYSVSIIGCGQKGTLFSIAFAEAGFKVTCTDPDQSLLKKLAKGKTVFALQELDNKLKNLVTKGQITFTDDLKKAVSQNDVIIIAVSAKVDDKKKIDYSDLLGTCKQVGAALHSGALVIYGEVAGFGFIEGAMKETLENTAGLKVNKDFGLAYSPLYISDGKATNGIGDLELKVSAIEKNSLTAASTILKTITSNVQEVSDVKTAEVVTLFTVAKKDADIALANELAIFCEKANIDFFKILEFFDVKASINFHPEIFEKKYESYLLLESGENLNAKLRLPTLARQVNEDMVKHATNLIQKSLHDCGKTLRRAKVAVLGAAGTKAAMDSFVKLVELKGAKISLYDPLSKKEPLGSMIKTSLNETVEGADCIVILSDQDQFRRLNMKKLRAGMKSPALVVDLVGILEPQKVETEGFIYRGLGRGAG